MADPIQLMVGLRNPGPDYVETRHNAGAWFVEAIAQAEGATFREEKKFSGQLATVTISGHRILLLLPNTWMNQSGLSVKAVSQFYKIPTHAILVAHDELDLPPGRFQMKIGGGHGGHNGLRDIIKRLGTPNFARCRVGIGHPGDRSQVHDYVLHRPSHSDKNIIMDQITSALHQVSSIAKGDFEAAMRVLHQREKNHGV